MCLRSKRLIDALHEKRFDYTVLSQGGVNFRLFRNFDFLIEFLADIQKKKKLKDFKPQISLEWLDETLSSFRMQAFLYVKKRAGCTHMRREYL